MTKRSLLSLLLLIPILLAGLAFSDRSPQPAPAPAQNSAITGFNEFVVHGTAWRLQNISRLSTFKPFAWGTLARAKSSGDAWVHIPMVYPTYIAGTPLLLATVEFCAQSSRGANTRPIALQVWENDTKIAEDSISWPSDNLYHCISHAFTPTQYEDIGLSVQLHFANATDTISLFKARLRVQTP